MGLIVEFDKITPVLGEKCFIAPSATIIGNTTVGNDVSFWYQTVVRGDVDSIKIGDGSNIQDFSMLHVTEGFPLTIGKGVTVGHRVTLHGCTIEDNCLIGMGAIVMDGAVIGKGSVVGAGSVVTEGKVFPPNSLIIGSPAKIKRELTTKEINKFSNHYKSYINYKNQYLKI